ncbi:RNA-binding RNA processing protein rpp1 [Balamuthia mandrillaris]
MDSLTASQKNDYAAAYAALILQDSSVAITADKLNAVLTAAGFAVPAFVTALYERAFGEKGLDALLDACSNVAVGGGAPAAAGGSSGAPAPKAEEKPAEKEEEAEEDLAAGGLFGDDDDY